MPLPTDEKLIALSEELIATFDQIFGLHPGFRPAHAKGVLLTGVFTPTAEAAKLSKAPHFVRESTPVSVRFSDSTGCRWCRITFRMRIQRGLRCGFTWRSMYTQTSWRTRRMGFRRIRERSFWSF